MELNLERPLLFFDIESTGLNIATDAIIELSFVKVMPDGEQKIKTWRIKPWDYALHRQIPISPSASAVNGVHDEDLKDCPAFINVVEEVTQWLEGSDLAGYNSTKFDLPMLAEEIERVRCYCEARIKDPGVPQDRKAKARELLEKTDIDLHACRMIDVQTIYHYMEPRNLKAAYRFYCDGKDFDNAHTAEADTLATYEVLKGQLDMYREADAVHETVLRNDVAYLAGLGGRPRGIDYAGRIIDRDGVPTIAFGKYKDRPVKDVFETDKGYFGWIANGDFTLDTKRQFRILFERYAKEHKEAVSRPLEGKDFETAADRLRAHFGKA